MATLTIAGVDVSASSLDATVTVGRDSVDSQPEASVLGVDIEGWQGAGNLGDYAVLSDSLGRMFGGVITDFDCDLDGLTGIWTTRLSAVGPLADLGRIYVGDDPWPQETDSQRIKRVLDLAGSPSNVNPGTYGPQVLARDVDHKTARDVIDDTADSALGVLWEQPADTATPVRYSPQRLRSWGPLATIWGEMATTWGAVTPTSLTWAQTYTTQPPGSPGSLTLDAGAIYAEVKFSQRVAALARKVRVAYGPEPDQGERTEAVVGSGSPEIKWDSLLAESTGAMAVADTILRARREPGWQLSEVVISLDDLPPETVQTIRTALAVGLRLTIQNIGFSSPVGTMWQGYLEGWQHQVGGDYHTLTLFTSDRKLTEPADRWQDVPVGTTWGNLNPAETWDTAVQVG